VGDGAEYRKKKDSLDAEVVRALAAQQLLNRPETDSTNNWMSGFTSEIGLTSLQQTIQLLTLASNTVACMHYRNLPG
jgi:hypothetical protein